MVHCI